jgi:hypothetical protein
VEGHAAAEAPEEPEHAAEEEAAAAALRADGWLREAAVRTPSLRSVSHTPDEEGGRPRAAAGALEDGELRGAAGGLAGGGGLQTEREAELEGQQLLGQTTPLLEGHGRE